VGKLWTEYLMCEKGVTNIINTETAADYFPPIFPLSRHIFIKPANRLTGFNPPGIVFELIII